MKTNHKHQEIQRAVGQTNAIDNLTDRSESNSVRDGSTVLLEERTVSERVGLVCLRLLWVE